MPKRHLDTIKFNPKLETVMAFISNIRMLFSVSTLPTSCASVSVVGEIAAIFQNMPKYPWKCLNKLLGPCQGSEYAWSIYMFERFLKMSWVLNKQGFWVWHGFIYKACAEFRIGMIMAPYTSIMLKACTRNQVLVDYFIIL